MSTTIRPARPQDLPALQRVEDDADRVLVERFRPDVWWPAADGADRAAEPGFLLVAADDDEVIGFVHVLEHDGVAHLEQLSVVPDRSRRGHGRALVRAAMHEALHRGHRELTLRTYEAVPWNAPFYASLGFVETTPSTPFHRGLVDAEARAGLDRYGRRIQMTTALGGGAAQLGGCS